MRKTLHHTFGKQLTVALALTVVSFMTISEAQAQASKTQKSDAARPENIESSHDTPPPVLIMNGSFILETAEGQFDETEISPNRFKKYKRGPKLPGKTKVYLAHIKILNGSGEVVFRGNYHQHASDVRVRVITNEGDVILASVSNKFEIETPGTKNFSKTSDQPTGTKRKGRFRYKNDTGSTEHDIKTVIVTKGPSTVLFDTDLNEVGPEFRVMIWLGEH